MQGTKRTIGSAKEYRAYMEEKRRANAPRAAEAASTAAAETSAAPAAASTIGIWLDAKASLGTVFFDLLTTKIEREAGDGSWSLTYFNTDPDNTNPQGKKSTTTGENFLVREFRHTLWWDGAHVPTHAQFTLCASFRSVHQAFVVSAASFIPASGLATEPEFRRLNEATASAIDDSINRGDSTFMFNRAPYSGNEGFDYLTVKTREPARNSGKSDANIFQPLMTAVVPGTLVNFSGDTRPATALVSLMIAI